MEVLFFNALLMPDILQHLMTCLLLSSCVYPAVQSGEVCVGLTRSLSRQGCDVMDHPGFCSSGWGGTEEYRSQRTYSPCVPHLQVNAAQRVACFRHTKFSSEWMLIVYNVCVLCLLQHPMLYRSDSADYRAQGPDMDSGVEPRSDMTPPTPAFPISPPTPYGTYSMFAMCLGFFNQHN